MWPPPAPPEYMDRSQLPSNLRPSALAAASSQPHDAAAASAAAAAAADDDDDDDASDSRLTRQRSSGSAAGPLKPSTDTSDHRDSELYHTASGETGGCVLRRSSSDVPRDHHQLKRTSSDDSDVRAKRPSDLASHTTSESLGHGGSASSHALMTTGDDRHTPGRIRR